MYIFFLHICIYTINIPVNMQRSEAPKSACVSVCVSLMYIYIYIYDIAETQ